MRVRGALLDDVLPQLAPVVQGMEQRALALRAAMRASTYDGVPACMGVRQLVSPAGALQAGPPRTTPRQSPRLNARVPCNALALTGPCVADDGVSHVPAAAACSLPPCPVPQVSWVQQEIAPPAGREVLRYLVVLLLHLGQGRLGTVTSQVCRWGALARAASPLPLSPRRTPLIPRPWPQPSGGASPSFALRAADDRLTTGDLG